MVKIYLILTVLKVKMDQSCKSDNDSLVKFNWCLFITEKHPSTRLQK